MTAPEKLISNCSGGEAGMIQYITFITEYQANDATAWPPISELFFFLLDWEVHVQKTLAVFRRRSYERMSGTSNQNAIVGKQEVTYDGCAAAVHTDA